MVRGCIAPDRKNITNIEHHVERYCAYFLIVSSYFLGN